MTILDIQSIFPNLMDYVNGFTAAIILYIGLECV